MADNINTDSPEIVADYYENYTDTQKEIFAIEIRKTKNILFTIASIIFAGNLLSLLMANAVYLQSILIISVIPVLFIGLAFLSLKEPLIAMIIAAVVITGVWVYSIAIVGGRAAVAGWLIKAVIVFFIIKGFRHAAEANKIKRELKL